MRPLLIILWLAMVSSALAQPTLRIGSNTRLVSSGAARITYGGGTLTNNGSLSMANGPLIFNGPTTYGGGGTATVVNLGFYSNTGNNSLNSLLSVTGLTVLRTNTVLNTNGLLYLRTDQFPNAAMITDGILTGTVQGLVTKATVTTGALPYTSTLSVNMSGRVMKYQWQSSANNSTFTDVPNATGATYAASVNASTYYRCRLTTSNSSYNQTTPAILLTLTPPGGGSFTITGASLVSCQLTNDRFGEYQVRFTPQYSGLTGDPVRFAVTNELATTTQPGPYSLRLYSDNPSIRLVAQQGSSQASFTYGWLAACKGGMANQPPTTTGIPDQKPVQGQPYQLTLSSYFTDPEGQPLTYSAIGLPNGLSLNGNIISGSPQAAGSSQVTVTAQDAGGLKVSTSFGITVSPAPTGGGSFTITGASLVSCQLTNARFGEYQVQFTPQYSGLTGDPVRFAVTNELATTTQPGPYSLRLYSDNPSIRLVAQQGSSQASFTYGWLAACKSGGRVGTTEPESRLQVLVLGNPVTDGQVRLEVRGVEGQPLRLRVIDGQGRPGGERQVERAGPVERLVLRVGDQVGGVLLLQVSTPTQQQTLKLLRAN